MQQKIIVIGNENMAEQARWYLYGIGHTNVETMSNQAALGLGIDCFLNTPEARAVSAVEIIKQNQESAKSNRAERRASRFSKSKTRRR